MGQFCNLMSLHAKFWEIKSKEKLTGLFWKEYYFRGKGGGGGCYYVTFQEIVIIKPSVYSSFW